MKVQNEVQPWERGWQNEVQLLLEVHIIMHIQSTLDISNTLYLELCPNSNKTLGPFSINSCGPLRVDCVQLGLGTISFTGYSVYELNVVMALGTRLIGTTMLDIK